MSKIVNIFFIFLLVIIIVVAVVFSYAYTTYSHLKQIKGEFDAIAQEAQTRQAALKEKRTELSQFSCSAEDFGTANLCLNNFFEKIDGFSFELSNFKEYLEKVDQRVTEMRPEIDKELRKIIIIAKIIQKEDEIKKIPEFINTQQENLKSGIKKTEEKIIITKQIREEVEKIILNQDSLETKQKEIKDLIINITGEDAETGI